MESSLKVILDQNEILKIMQNFTPANTRTAQAYKLFVKKYLAFAEVRRLKLIQPETLQTYISSLMDAGKTARTINAKLAGIKAAIIFTIKSLGLRTEQEAIIKTALKEIKGVKVGSAANTVKKDRMLSESEYTQVISKASKRNALFIEFLFLTGCRVSEMVNAKIQNINRLNDIVEIRVSGKGAKERIVKIHIELLERIKNIFNGKNNLFETASGKPYQREYVSSQIKKTVRRILAKTTSAHDLRHSFANIMLRKTGKLKAVSEYLGHYSTAITMDVCSHEELTNNDLFGGLYDLN